MEQGSIQQQIYEFALWCHFLAIYVDDVREQLESVERNTDWQSNLRNFFWKMEDRVVMDEKKVRYLKIQSRPNINTQSQIKNILLSPSSRY